jgi:hypothetical protein
MTQTSSMTQKVSTKFSATQSNADSGFDPNFN